MAKILLVLILFIGLLEGGFGVDRRTLRWKGAVQMESSVDNRMRRLNDRVSWRNRGFWDLMLV